MFGKTKRTFGIGLRAVALAIGLATLLGGAHQAVAGSWVPFGGNGIGTYEINDGYTVVGTSKGSNNSVGYIQPWDHGGYCDDSPGGCPQAIWNSSSSGGTVVAQGTVSRTFKWIPAAGKDLISDPPPGVLRVNVSAGCAVGVSALSCTLVPIVDNGFTGYPGTQTQDVQRPDFKFLTKSGTFSPPPIYNVTSSQIVTTPPYAACASAAYTAQGQGGTAWASAAIRIVLAP